MQCNNCMKFKGDCGYHFRDNQGHIIYDCPRESCCDRYENCNHYEEKRNKYQVQLDLIESGDVEELDLEVVKEALEYTMMKRR